MSQPATQNWARWLRLQTMVSLGLAGILLVWNPVWSYSAFFGSLAAFLPTAMFAILVLRRIGGDSGDFLRTAVLAEAGKLLLMGVLCALVFVWVKPLAAGWFFLGLIAVLATGWIGLARQV